MSTNDAFADESTSGASAVENMPTRIDFCSVSIGTSLNTNMPHSAPDSNNANRDSIDFRVLLGFDATCLDACVTEV